MSSVVDMQAPYIATGTAAPLAATLAAATPSARENHLHSAWSALEQALQEDRPLMPNEVAIDEAYAILEMLPSRVPPPEPVIEDSGTIAWVWDSHIGKFLAFAVNGTGMVQRSAIVDGQRSWATTPLMDRLSEPDMELLAKFSSVHA